MWSEKKRGLRDIGLVIVLALVLSAPALHDVHAEYDISSLLDKLGSSDQTEMRSAQFALMNLGTEAVPPLISALKDETLSSQTKVMCLYILEQMGIAALDAIPVMEELVITGSPNVQSQAKLALDEIEAYQQAGLPGLPEDAKLYVIGTRKGPKELEVQLGKSGADVTQVDVIVSEESHPVVLVLSSSSSIVWKVGRTENATIAGVVVVGGQAQALLGIPYDVPHKVLSGVQERPPKSFYINERDDLRRNENYVRALTGKEVEKYFGSPTGNEVYFVGPPVYDLEGNVVYSDDLKMDLYPVYKAEIPAGQKGIEALVGKGKLRKATAEERQAWRDGSGGKKDYMAEHNTYVVLEAFDVPPGLYGAHSCSFIIPEGVSRPGGEKGHCTFYFMEDFRKE